jgi:hypothetical protein
MIDPLEFYASYTVRYVEFLERLLDEQREDEGSALVDELTGASFPAISVHGGPAERPVWVYEGRTEHLEGQP